MNKLILPVFVLLLSAAGCSDDDPDVCVEFVAAAAPAAGTVAITENPSSTCGAAVLDLIVTDVSGVFGASFDLVFDPTAVSYQGLSTTGSFLGTNLQSLVDLDTGSVSIGITRTGTTSTADAVGSQVLATVTFLRNGASGMSSLQVTDESLLDNQMPPQSLAGVSWSGGSFQLQ